MSHFWLITGNDDFLVQREATLQFQQLSKSLDPYACETINGSAQNVAEVEKIIHTTLELLETQGLFSEHKVILLKNVNFLADNVTGRAEGTKNLLQKLIKCIENQKDDKVKLILSAFPVDRRRKEYKTLESLANSQYLETPTTIEEAMPYLQKESKSQHIHIQPDALTLLYEKVHGSLRMAINEIQKLATFIGPEGTIMPHHVEDMVAAFGEVDFFYAAEMFFSNNLQSALKALQEHYFIHKESRPLITALQNRTRLLIQLKSLLDAGQLKLKGPQLDKSSLEQAKNLYPFEDQEKTTLNIFSQHPWYLGKLAQTLQKKNLKTLVNYQLDFLNALKSILKSPENTLQILENLYIKAIK